MRRAHLPILEPCAEDWSAMTGDERRRHCSSCDREVLHLSAMTADEARRALVARPGERVCVRYSCDADDNIVFAAPRLRAAMLATALAACTASEAPRSPSPPGSCDEEPPVVEDEPELCEEELLPEEVELPGEVVDVELPFEARGVPGSVAAVTWTTMGVPSAVGVVAEPPELVVLAPTVRAPTAAASTERAPPRHVVPLDSWMGTVPLDVLAAVQPRRRVDEE